VSASKSAWTLLQESSVHRHVFFLILGTAIGAGMMTLPLVTQGLSLSVLTLVLAVSAVIMYLAAQLWIELSLSAPPDSNLATFVRQWASSLEYPTHLAYLAFFWSLMACYLSTMPTFLAPYLTFAPWLNHPVMYSIALSIFLYVPKKFQGLMNQIFVLAMICVLGLIFTLTTYEIQHDWRFPELTQYPKISILAPLMMFFGYHLTIPSFPSFVSNKKELEKICMTGTAAIFILYWVWCTLLLSALSAVPATSSATNLSDNGFLESFSKFTQSALFLQPIAWFSLLAMWTSCLGMSLGTFDYLRDLLRARKEQNFLIVLLTVLPSLFFLYVSDQAYRTLLNFAAYLALYLLIALPAFLICRRDYGKKITSIYIKACTLLILTVGLLIVTPV